MRTGAFIGAALGLLMLASCGKGNKTVEPALKESEHYLQASPTSLLGPYESNTAFSNGFIYYGTGISLIEYDTVSGSQTVIKPELLENELLSCYSLYDGYIYAVKMTYSTDSAPDRYSIVRIDYNTGDTAEIYAPDNNGDIISYMTVSSDGKLFFVQGEDIRSCGMDGGSTETLTQGTTYYIEDDTLFFTRTVENSARLYFSPMSDPGAATDTGVTMAEGISGNVPFMYCPVKGGVYYSEDNRLMYLDADSVEIREICAFDQESFVRYFQPWNGRLAVLVREKRAGSSWYQYGLYCIEENGEVTKAFDETAFNKDYPLGFEYIDFCAVFNGYDEGFIISNYDPRDDRRVYLVNNDLELTRIISIGEWDYESYAEEQIEVEKIIAGEQRGGHQ